MPNKFAKAPREIFKAHPIFGWSLTPRSRIAVKFRDDVVQHIDNNGNRLVTHAGDAEGKKRLTCYGCSFTYGTALADEETFPSLLQDQFPEFQVTNKGVGGNSSVQALLRFRDDVLRERVDVAIFGVISDHRYRNVPHPYRMKAYLSPGWRKIDVEQIPHGKLNRDGDLEIVYTPIWHPVVTNNIRVFLPDEHMLDLVTLAVFKEIRAMANDAGVPVVFALLDQLDPRFNTKMSETFTETCDVSVPLNDTYNFAPHDLHPNALANQVFAERLQAIVKSRHAQVG